jgi:hypothetical protein
MKSERIIWELEAEFREALAEQQRISAITKETADRLTGVARRHYQNLGELDAAGLRKLGELISRASCRFATELEHIIADAEERTKT